MGGQFRAETGGQFAPETGGSVWSGWRGSISADTPYYEIVESRMDLIKAIDWCQKSIDFNSGKENNDTLAHLYFKTGDWVKAVEYQTIALNIAESEGLQKDRLKYYKDELEKFKSQ